jgi:hypothetical protein
MSMADWTPLLDLNWFETDRRAETPYLIGLRVDIQNLIVSPASQSTE